MGLDELHLRVLSTSSEDLAERRNAQKGEHLSLNYLRDGFFMTRLRIVLKLMQRRRHWVLVVFYPYLLESDTSTF
jgi:metal transporter CNNM